MGLNINLVIIEGHPSCSVLELIESLGFKKVSIYKDALLSDFINPVEGFISIAFWKNFTIVAHDTLPISIINLDFSRKRYFEEITLRRYFDSKNFIAALLQSTTNTYGMCLRIANSYSTIYGHSGGFQITRGKRTQIELDYLENSYINADREVIYKIEGNEFTHDQIGEDIVLRNLEEFTEMLSGELFDLKCQVFKVSDEHLAYHA